MSISKGLYPSIAVSDAFNAAGHILAAYAAFRSKNILASLGFLSVAVAAIVGVLRFGFNEFAFAQMNSSLADYAAFVGLPCVGLTFIRNGFLAVYLLVPEVVLVFALGLIEAVTRGFQPEKRELSKIIVNMCFFVLPVLIVAWREKSYTALGGMVLFVIAGLVITADRQKTILGVRCENWFHYFIGVAAYLISDGL